MGGVCSHSAVRFARETPPVEFPNLRLEFGNGAAHRDGVGDLLDGEGGDWAGTDAPVVEPAAKLGGRSDVDDGAEADPGVGGGAHGAVFAGGVDGALGAHLGG